MIGKIWKLADRGDRKARAILILLLGLGGIVLGSFSMWSKVASKPGRLGGGTVTGRDAESYGGFLTIGGLVLIIQGMYKLYQNRNEKISRGGTYGIIFIGGLVMFYMWAFYVARTTEQDLARQNALFEKTRKPNVESVVQEKEPEKIELSPSYDPLKKQ